MRKFLRTAFGLPDVAPKALPSTAMVPVPVIRPSAEAVPLAPAMAYLDRGGTAGGSWGNPNVMPLRSADDAVRGAWAPVTGNVRHLIQNTGWLSGAVDQFTSYAVGTGLTPNIEPANHLIDSRRGDWWKGWAREVEAMFAEWADDPQAADERGVHTFGALQAQALRTWFSTGDVIGVLGYDEARPGWWRTSMNLIDPVRVSTPTGLLTGRYSVGLTEGIELDDKGRPLAIWIEPLPGSRDHRGTRIAFNSDAGRQLIAHAFVGEAGQVRGISPFAPVVEALKQTISLSDAMLMAAHAAASVIGTVTSDMPSDAVARSLVADGGDPMTRIQQAREDWHENLAGTREQLTLGKFGRVHHLTTGERFDLHAAKDHYAAFPEHMKLLLREISRASGLPYEMLSLDRKGATYSSGRLGLLDFWSLVEQRRSTLIEPLCRLALHGVVEEAVARGSLAFPGGLKGFRRDKNAALKSRWFGPAKPSVDELKAVKASVERLKAGLTSLAEEVASNGSDWETVMRQRAHERETAADLGLPDTWSSPMPTNTGGKR